MEAVVVPNISTNGTSPLPRFVERLLEFDSLTELEME